MNLFLWMPLLRLERSHAVPDRAFHVGTAGEPSGTCHCSEAASSFWKRSQLRFGVDDGTRTLFLLGSERTASPSAGLFLLFRLSVLEFLYRSLKWVMLVL